MSRKITYTKQVGFTSINGRTVTNLLELHYDDGSIKKSWTYMDTEEYICEHRDKNGNLLPSKFSYNRVENVVENDESKNDENNRVAFAAGRAAQSKLREGGVNYPDVSVHYEPNTLALLPGNANLVKSTSFKVDVSDSCSATPDLTKSLSRQLIQCDVFVEGVGPMTFAEFEKYANDNDLTKSNFMLSEGKIVHCSDDYTYLN